ncbi:unnamed protein product [Coccothraustes coccothraustes]
MGLGGGMPEDPGYAVRPAGSAQGSSVQCGPCSGTVQRIPAWWDARVRAVQFARRALGIRAMDLEQQADQNKFTSPFTVLFLQKICTITSSSAAATAISITGKLGAVAVSECEQRPIHDCCNGTEVGDIAKMMGQVQSVRSHSRSLAEP